MTVPIGINPRGSARYELMGYKWDRGVRPHVEHSSDTDSLYARRL